MLFVKGPVADRENVTTPGALDGLADAPNAGCLRLPSVRVAVRWALHPGERLAIF